MHKRRIPALKSPLLRWALHRARRGEVNTKVVVIVVLGVIGGFLLLACGGLALITIPAIQQAREAARRSVAQNNLQQIGLALHNYHDTYTTFPPGGIHGEDGTEYISWQTSLLPFVDQAPLYDVIHQDVAWTDPVNSGYYSTVVPTYLHPSISENPFNGQGLAVSHYAGNSQVFGPNSHTRLSDIIDGTTNTVLAGDVAAGFRAWADPGNLRDPAAGLAAGLDTFSGPEAQQGTQFLMADGSVRFVNDDVSQDVLEAIATPAGREPVPAF